MTPDTQTVSATDRRSRLASIVESAAGWSVPVGHAFGTQVRLHGSLILLIGLYASYCAVQLHPLHTAWYVLLTVAIYFCGLLHELGHTLAARRFGIRTRVILMHPLGGVAQLEALPGDPRAHLFVALAGPAVSLVIAGFCAALIFASGGASIDVMRASFWLSMLCQLAWFNTLFVVLNMLPAYPMDGGRVLWSILAMCASHSTARRVTSCVGLAASAGITALAVWIAPQLIPAALLITVLGFMARDPELRSIATDAADDPEDEATLRSTPQEVN